MKYTDENPEIWNKKNNISHFTVRRKYIYFMKWTENTAILFTTTKKMTKKFAKKNETAGINLPTKTILLSRAFTIRGPPLSPCQTIRHQTSVLHHVTLRLHWALKSHDLWPWLQNSYCPSVNWLSWPICNRIFPVSVKSHALSSLNVNAP